MRASYSVQIRIAGIEALSHVLVEDAIDAEDAKRQVQKVLPRHARMTGTVFIYGLGMPLVQPPSQDPLGYAVKVKQ